MLPPEASAAFEVWEEHAETVRAFIACGSQWQFAGMSGVRVGLLYTGVEAVLRLTVSREQRRAVFEGIQVMEQAALAAWATAKK